MRILFLDDERNPEDVTWVDYPEGSKFVIVRSFKEFFQTLQVDHNFDAWSLDHDLGINGLSQEINPSGYDVLKSAINWYPEYLPKQIVAHSKNPIGAKNIDEYWRNYVSSWD